MPFEYDHDDLTRSLPSGHGGTGNALKTVALTGDQSIDGVLTAYAWGGTSIDYSFPTSSSVYGYTQQTDLPAGFFAPTSLQQTAARFALDANTGTNVAAKAGFSVEGFTNLGVNYDSTPDSDQIRLANTTSPNVPTAEVADFPGNYLTSQLQDNGDVWFGTYYAGTSNDYTTPVAGNYAWHTAIHEIGHALGLKHAHENSLAGPVPANVNSIEFSVMSYRSYIGGPLSGYTYEQWGAPQTYMMLDIAALQHMYGADFTTNSGDTVYSWNQASGNTVVNGSIAIQPGGNKIFATIWDGGGTDTYDLSHYSSNLSIDLTPGGYSTFATPQLADLGSGHLAHGNIFNARLYEGDTRSLIENVIGGASSDYINGNQANNNLQGKGGVDTLLGNDGNDTLDGGAQADTVSGGIGNDIVLDIDGINSDYYNGENGSDTINYSADNFAASAAVTINLTTGLASASGGLTETIASFENVVGSQGAETITGTTGANVIRGAGGRDVMIGGAGNDRFDFDLITNSRVGNAVCDILQAGAGSTAAFDLPGANNPASGGDRIDVSTIDANSGAGGNQTFIFGGTGAGHIRCLNSGTTTQVLAYINGDSTADFQLNIQDGNVMANAYTAADFIL